MCFLGSLHVFGGSKRFLALPGVRTAAFGAHERGAGPAAPACLWQYTQDVRLGVECVVVRQLEDTAPRVEYLAQLHGALRQVGRSVFGG